MTAAPEGSAQPLLETFQNRTFVTRWYVLCLLSLLTCIQNVVWAGWGPIAQSAKAVYHWTDSTIDMLTNAGNIATMVLIIPASWMLDAKGLRMSVVVASVTIATGAGIRCITTEPRVATWLIAFGQTLNGVGGTVTAAAPPLLSETWFPLDERTTATGVGILFSAVGGALASVLGPHIVPEPITCDNSSSFNETACNVTKEEHIKIIRERIQLLNYSEFGIAALLIVLTAFYFPNKPSSPPSLSARNQRMLFRDGLKFIARLLPFWHVALAFAIPIGVMGVWGITLDVTLGHFNISQKTSGWIAFFGSVGGIIVGLVLSRFADIFKKRLRIFLILTFTLSAICYAVFTLVVSSYIHTSFNNVLIYITYIGGTMLSSGSMPLYYEMACETAYPAAEGVVSGCMTLMLNLSGSLVLLLSLVPNIGTAWMNWAMVIAAAITVPLLTFFKETYNRTDIDMRPSVEPSN